MGYAVAGQGALMLGKNLCRVGQRPKSQATTMRHDYSDPVARLLDYGGFDIRQIEEPWPDYLELGFAFMPGELSGSFGPLRRQSRWFTC
jgi:hypothetical protein